MRGAKRRGAIRPDCYATDTAWLRGHVAHLRPAAQGRGTRSRRARAGGRTRSSAGEPVERSFAEIEFGGRSGE